jgi:hypothetical protein
MKLFRAAALSALCATLLACAQKPAPPPASPAPPSSRAEPMEGTYRGSSTRFQADQKGCPRPGLVTIVVWDNRFQYRWDHKTYIDVVLNDDGSIQGSDADISLRGRRDGQRIEGDVTNGTCGLHFTLTKRDT